MLLLPNSEPARQQLVLCEVATAVCRMSERCAMPSWPASQAQISLGPLRTCTSPCGHSSWPASCTLYEVDQNRQNRLPHCLKCTWVMNATAVDLVSHLASICNPSCLCIFTFSFCWSALASSCCTTLAPGDLTLCASALVLDLA